MKKVKNIELIPLDFREFQRTYTVEKLPESEMIDHMHQYLQQIIPNCTSNFFWFISGSNLSVLDCSDNLHEMTPYKKNEWKKHYPNFLEPIMLKKDFDFLMSASGYMMKFLKDLPAEDRSNYKINLYCRMMDSSGKMRWVVFHAPVNFFDEDGFSICSLVLVSELGLLDISNEPRMNILDITDFRNPKEILVLDEHFFKTEDFPQLSKREKEIVVCIIQGMKTPEIAEKLFISYNTVENHKKNLRTKTGTHTAGELISYILRNNLI